MVRKWHPNGPFPQACQCASHCSSRKVWQVGKVEWHLQLDRCSWNAGLFPLDCRCGANRWMIEMADVIRAQKHRQKQPCWSWTCWCEIGHFLKPKGGASVLPGPQHGCGEWGSQSDAPWNFWFCHVILLSPTWNSEAFAPEEMLPRSMRPSFFLRGIPWPLMKQLDADGHNMTCARSGYRRIPSLFIWMMLVSCSYRQGLFGCVFFR